MFQLVNSNILNIEYIFYLNSIERINAYNSLPTFMLYE